MLLRGLLLAFFVLVIDQISKWYIFDALATHGPVVEILPFFNLVTVWNKGISFGMFHDVDYGKWIFVVISLVITVVLVIWLTRATLSWTAYAVGMVIGGAIGNVIDRVRFGAVADFLDFHLGGYHWPAFNIADSAVFIGVAMLCLESVCAGNGKTQKEA